MQERSYSTVLLIVLLVGFAFLVIKNAWLGDDAYITLRTVENFVNGYGLVWNVAERVQAYTHPLWMFLLSAVYFVMRDVYFATIGASITVSLLTLWLLVRSLAKSELTVIVAIITLSLSKAYVEYATSGLENPLTHLLLVLFFIYFFQERVTLRRFLMLVFISSLLCLNRMDTILLCLPALCFAWWQVRSWRAIGWGLVAFSPFIAWELFATFYYGFPFPNTAYAKLNTYIEQAELWKQGFTYFTNTMAYDPITLFGILLGCFLALWSRQRNSLLVALGIGLYLLYIGRIGGDFMRGRFFTAPLLCAMIVITQLDFGRIPLAKAALYAGSYIVILILIAFMTGSLEIKQTSPSGFDRGIADERLYYYNKTGLLNIERYERARRQGLIKGMDFPYITVTCGGLGQWGFVSGPQYHVVDDCGLADPLIARLPATYDPAWRVGHYSRAIPVGYLGSLRTKQNLFEDKSLGDYYQKLAVITTAPLFSWERLKMIVAFNLGKFDHLIDTERYRFPPEIMRSYDYETIAAQKLPIDLRAGGIIIDFEQPQHAAILDLGLNSDWFEVNYSLNGDLVSKQTIQIRFASLGKRAIHWVEVPQEAEKRGFDRLHILPLRPNTTDNANYFGGLVTLSADSTQWPFDSLIRAYTFSYWRSRQGTKLDALRQQILQSPPTNWSMISLEEKLALLDTGDTIIHTMVMNQLESLQMVDQEGKEHLLFLGAILTPVPPPLTPAETKWREENKSPDNCQSDTPVINGTPYTLQIHFEALHHFFDALPIAKVQITLADQSVVTYKCVILDQQILDIGLISSPILTLTLPKNYNSNSFDLIFEYRGAPLATLRNGESTSIISFR